MRMKLIDDTARRVETIVSAVVGGEGFHHTAFELIDDGVAVRGEVVLQVGGLDYLHCIREADLRLILDGSS